MSLSTLRIRTRGFVVLMLATALAVAALTSGGAVQSAAAAPSTPSLSSAAARSASVANGNAAGVDRVVVGPSKVTVSGKLGSSVAVSGTQVALYALDVSQDPGDYASGDLIATVTPTADGAFTASVARTQGTVDLYNDKFLAVAQTASGDTVLGAPAYPTDETFVTPNNYAYPTTTTIKGLTISSMTDDTEQLGIQHADENVVLNSIMLAGPGASGTYLTFDSGGTTYYFSKSAVATIDQQVRSMTENGVVVDMIVLLSNTSLPLLFPGADTSQGTIFAYNTKTAQGVAWVRAGFEFLASRYERADAKYGRADDFIVGNEVDAAFAWYNMGDQSLADFVEYYGRALRLMYLAARNYYPNPRVYASLENHWGQTVDATQPLRAYDSKDVLDALESTEKSEGDFPWNLAYHPYPENLFDPATWNDPDVHDSFSSPFITFKNIQELPKYMQQSQLEFGGQQRHIILSEQGCNTPSSSQADQELQAACFAYAYYKIFFAGGIDAFNYHRDIDHPAEGGLEFGLWNSDPNEPLLDGYNMPGSPKYIYDVFKYIDTSRSLQVTKFALPIIGITNWKQVISNFDPAKLAARPIAGQLTGSAGAQPIGEKVLANFAGSTDGWRESDNADAVGYLPGAGPVPGNGLLRVHFDSGLDPINTDAKVWKGADVVLAQPLNACATPNVDLDLRIPVPAAGQFPDGTTFSAQVRVYGAGGRMASGTAPVDANGAWSQLSFAQPGWSGCKAISRIKVLVSATGDSRWLGTFDLAQVGVSRGVAGDVRQPATRPVRPDLAGHGAD